MSPATDGPRIRVVIADDHAVVRRGLRALFDRDEEIHVVAETEDVAGTFDAVRDHRPRVLVLDLHMGGESSLGRIRDLRQAAPATQIVVLTMQTDPTFAREAVMAGAAGFLTKEAGDDTIAEAIRAVARGGTYLEPGLGVAALAGATQGTPADLTPRETDVLRLAALGHTNPEIAEQLHVSLRTVETHRSHIQSKLGLARRADLVRFALDHGLIK